MLPLFALVLSRLFFFAQAGDSCNVVTHDEWGALPAEEVFYIIRPIPYVIIQHTATPECDTNAECENRVANIQENHIGLDYGDIGPSFLIGGDGRVYEGAGWLHVGAHTYGYNKKSIGISFIGDFREKLPMQEALDAAQELIRCGVRLGHLEKNYKLLGHKQTIATESPGRALYKEIRGWRNWASRP